LPKYDSNILKNHEIEFKRELKEEEFSSMLDVFKKIPKEKFVCYDLTENLEDFKDYDLYSKNEYFKNKIEKIKNWEVIDNQLKGGTRKHQTISEFVFVAETNERFLIIYQIEKRQSELV
jgi:hypothetical protein